MFIFGKKSQKLEPEKISCHTVVRNRPLYIGTFPRFTCWCLVYLLFFLLLFLCVCEWVGVKRGGVGVFR